MKKKGFTLIELLTIIVVLAVILAITVPSVRTYISNSYAESYKLDLKAMEEAAKAYVIDNKIKFEEVERKIVQINTLVEEGLLDPIIDPQNKEQCEGYVIVDRNYRKYTYKAHLKCGTNYVSDRYGYTDNVFPEIFISGDNPVTIEVGSTYVDAGATATDNIDGNITSNIVTIGEANPDEVGTYIITYSVTDSSGNTTTGERIVNVVDTTAPNITFGTNGNATWAKTRSTTVTVSDAGGINTSSLKYLWNTSTSTPSEGSFSTTFTSGGTINSPAGVTGGYYLWILAKDSQGNTAIMRTNVFNLDNTPPVITMNGNSPVEVIRGGTYTDAGAAASDAHSGLEGDVVPTGEVNVNTVGTYHINYNVSDKAGNAAVQVTRTVNVVLPNYSGPGYIESKGVNGPVLATGMTPIKWSGSAWVNTTVNDDAWYNYTTSDKKWANAKTADGSMWVWIPRYVYKISTNWHTTTAGTINIQFSMGTDDTRGGTVTLDSGTGSSASNNKWTNHPAFTFGTTQLTGIWVAKFEATAAEGVSNSEGGDNVTSKNVKIVPNVQSWRYISIGNMFTVTRNMETSNIYGWGTSGSGIDTHLMKNVEWGAVAYLSKSTYGKSAEVWINNSNTNETGCAGSGASSGPYSGCQNRYNTSNGQQASTTGNIYGIYDMNGGAFEYVAAYANNTSALEYGSVIYNAASKYKEVYYGPTSVEEYVVYDRTAEKKGDALYETSGYVDAYGGNIRGWYSDWYSGTYGGGVWYARGNYYNNYEQSGIFASFGFGGNPDGIVSFRPTLVVGSGL